jgi:hypothetical protein
MKEEADQGPCWKLQPTITSRAGSRDKEEEVASDHPRKVSGLM